MKIDLEKRFKEFLITEFGKELKDAHNQEIFFALSRAIRESYIKEWQSTENNNFSNNKKQAYYFSSEFLMGRFLGNNVINLKLDKEIKSILEKLNIDYDEIENIEADAGLGNGGLGRLAACFLDSAATHKIPLHGYGIRYQYGIFKQKIENGFQVEYPNNWLKYKNPWELRKSEDSVNVKFGGNVEVHFKAGEAHFEQENYESVIAVPYDYPVIGYDGCINTLRLWAAESPKYFDLELFNNGEYDNSLGMKNRAENISRVLYPNDNHYQGKLLRLRQQYFFSSASLQDLVRKFKKHVGNDFSKFPDYYAIQLNDTHPVVSIPELMRILLDEEVLEWDKAWEICKKTFSYTNHTILQEALEKWDISIFKSLLPRIYQIIEEINRRLTLLLQIKYPSDYNLQREMAILADGKIKMAFLAIEGSNSVNGVAALHTEILKNIELKNWYNLYPEKFNNKTNGVTQRRWLLKSNEKLANLISSKIGESWIKELSDLDKLTKYVDDETFQNEFNKIKRENKLKLVKYIKEKNNIDIDPDSIFDVQIKRLHEYKRQLLNVFHILYQYNQLKKGNLKDMTPKTYIFSAKAASGYHVAKLIIKLINSIADLINNDKDINNKIKVVFLENYNVSLAEIIFPASEVSEQISTAGKEASGTGNMKFMINGALTIGTMDGANVEIVEEVGKENAFIFGLSSKEVEELRNSNSYCPMKLYQNNQDIKEVLDLLNSDVLAPNYPGIFKQLFDSLIYGSYGSSPDLYFVLKDFNSYKKAQMDLDKLYKDNKAWTRSALLNIAKSGKFSSDRTIKQYAKEIWKLEF